MELPQPELPEMVMCGDHPSFGRMDLNIAEKLDDKEKVVCYNNNNRISPSTSHTRTHMLGGELVQGSVSEAALKQVEVRRRLRSLEIVARTDADAAAPENKALVQGVGSNCELLVAAALKSLEYRGRGNVKRTKRNEVVPMNHLLVQAALGSFRWPPYLLLVWVAVLVLTHLLHCLVTLLERALPNLRKCCHYFKQWTEKAWKEESDQNKVLPVSLACATVILYFTYFVLYAMYTIAFWSIEPLCADLDVVKSGADIIETKSTGCDAVVSKQGCDSFISKHNCKRVI